jgi:polysaccharide biosynthesis transport protein
MVLGLVSVTLVTIYLSTMDQKPYYQAAVQMMPSDTALYRPILPSPAATVDAAGGGRQTDSQMPNLMSLVKSRRVAERTIRVAGLKEDPDSLVSRIVVSTAANPGAQSRQDTSTDIIEVRVLDGEPQRAVRTVNALAHVFSSFYQEISHQEASDNRRFLEAELVRAQNELGDASDRLRTYKARTGVTSVGDATNGASTDLRQAMSQRDAARAALSEANARLREVQSQLRRTKPSRTVEEGTSNTPMVQQLQTQLATLTTQLTDARAKYEEGHPQVVALKDSIAQAQTRLNQERGKMATSTSEVRNPVFDTLLQQCSQLAADRNGLAARASELEAAVSRATRDLKPGSDVELNRLESAFQTSQAAYNNLQTQLNQARISEKETTGTGAIRVIDEAIYAEGPLGTNRLAYLIFGAILSLFVGLGLAITLDSLDNRLKTTFDVEEMLGIPVTTLIPRAIGPGSSALARVTYTDPLSPIAEAYRFLRTDLLLCTETNGAKSIMVATAKPGQGGTITAANLGISLAMDGKRVILVDADMRRPSLHRIFKAPNDYGLSNLLANEKDLEEVIFSTEIENLLLIPGGPEPSNPSELLGSERMKRLTAKLSEHADFVLFDTPSAIAFTDAVVLSRIVDGVVLVVRAQTVPRGAELQVRNLLNKAKANILGVVLNDVEPEMVDSYYYHSHYYPDVDSMKSQVAMPMADPAPSLPAT